MAKRFQSKWKRRTLTVLSLAMASALAMGAFAACDTVTPDEDETSTPKTDTQLIKNGNFEFYGDKTVTDRLKRYNLINSPDSWNFSAGSPASDTKSGVVSAKDWKYITQTGGYSFKTFDKATDGNEEETESVTTFETIEEAYANWENDNVSAYDRVKFLELFEDEIDDLDRDSDEYKLFTKYNYSSDFEDLEKLREEVGDELTLHDGVASDEDSVLMIHNSKTSDDVRGTAQYYTSSTTLTLAAGTAAHVSVWVRTDALYHYEDTELSARGGAYIGVTNTVGGTTLDQMQIYNINTRGNWQQYTLYVRASTFATTTFRIVLGLGQGSSDDRYYSVDGYAFFDDLTCELISGKEYEEEVARSNARECTVDSLKEEKRFDTDFVDDTAFALDLYAGFDSDRILLSGDDVAIGLTEEVSGSNTFTSGRIDPSLGDNKETNFAAVTTLDELATSANSYVKKVYENDLKEKYPFGEGDSKIVMLLSGNGAAYTAKLPELTLKKDERLLISFFMKTSEIDNGLTGGGATVVDGVNKTYITSVDTTTLGAVDIDSKSDDEAKKDIYKGWTQCFFFLENTTDEDKTFHLELTYGPTTITGTNKFAYGDGYAAFTNFETKLLSKTEYSYASTGDRAKKVSLTGVVEETKKFDSVSAVAEKDLENGLALPANFRGVLGGSDFVQENETFVPNEKPATVDAGLLSSKYAENYFQSAEAWKGVLDGGASGAANHKDWWTNLFGNARQPLVIVNRSATSYGFFAETATVSTSSTRRISMRVKASIGAKAYIYLTDVSTAENSGNLILPNLPGYTYWYDDDGNICRIDPADEDFDDEKDILYRLEDNGLYTRVNGASGTYYANLGNYEKDSEGNLITKDGTIAFYAHDGKLYARRTEKKIGEYTYSVEVTALPTDICRYDYSDKEQLPGTSIVVDGTGDWVTVNFYLRTGNEAKDYRLEVWSGDRTGENPNPENSYVFFDNYASADASSDFSTILDLSVSELKDRINEENGKELGDEGYLGEDDNLPEEYAKYYTFTFYDSTSFLRYDKELDEDEVGNPYGNYTQSDYEESLVSFYYMETEADVTSYSYFLDYSSIDVTVTPQDLDTDDDDTDTDTDEDTDQGSIWMLIASGSLAIVLLFVVVAVVIRRLTKKYGRRSRLKVQQDKRFRPAKKGASKEAEETDETPEEK